MQPTTIYGICKVTGELLGNYYNHKYGLDTRSIRFPGIISNKTLPGGGTLQGTLDGIYPKLLPLGFTLLCWWLMTKKKVSPIVTMLILLVIAFVGAAVGFFGAATIAAPTA